MTPLIGIAAGLLIVAAFMLVAGYGAPALWIAVATVGIAMVVVARVRGQRPAGR